MYEIYEKVIFYTRYLSFLKFRVSTTKYTTTKYFPPFQAKYDDTMQAILCKILNFQQLSKLDRFSIRNYFFNTIFRNLAFVKLIQC